MGSFIAAYSTLEYHENSSTAQRATTMPEQNFLQSFVRKVLFSVDIHKSSGFDGICSRTVCTVGTGFNALVPTLLQPKFMTNK